MIKNVFILNFIRKPVLLKIKKVIPAAIVVFQQCKDQDPSAKSDRKSANERTSTKLKRIVCLRLIIFKIERRMTFRSYRRDRCELLLKEYKKRLQLCSNCLACCPEIKKITKNSKCHLLTFNVIYFYREPKKCSLCSCVSVLVCKRSRVKKNEAPAMGSCAVSSDRCCRDDERNH